MRLNEMIMRFKAAACALQFTRSSADRGQSNIAQLATPLFIASISQVVISTNADRSAHALRHRSHCPESATLVNLQIVSTFRSPSRSMRSGTIDAVTDCTDAMEVRS